MDKLKWLVLPVFLIILLAGAVSAVSVGLDWEIEINGDNYDRDEVVHLERGEDLDIGIKFTAFNDAENVELRAFFSGYEYSDHEAGTSDMIFIDELDSGVTYTEDLNLELPDKLDIKDDNYKLRIIFSDQNGYMEDFTYDLRISTVSHGLKIKDVVFSPEYRVQAGRALLSSVRIWNMGKKAEDGVKVKVSIPELGVSASEYMDEVEAEDTKTSEELYLRIPSCAAPGSYQVNVELEYDEGYETSEVTKTIEITEGELCRPTTTGTKTSEDVVISVASQIQDVQAGQTLNYPVVISNLASEAKTFTVSADMVDWGTVSVTPGNVVVVGPKSAESMVVKVSSSKDATAGQKMLSVSVKGDGQAEQLVLKANVIKSAGWSATKVLQVILAIVIVLLIIIGLIIGFNRLRGDEDFEDDESGQTYY